MFNQSLLTRDWYQIGCQAPVALSLDLILIDFLRKCQRFLFMFLAWEDSFLILFLTLFACNLIFYFITRLKWWEDQWLKLTYEIPHFQSNIDLCIGPGSDNIAQV